MTPALSAAIAYLDSDAAQDSIDRDPYWPKWNSPWWQMLAMHEMGLADQIPRRAIAKLVSKLNAYYLPIFPSRPGDVPRGMDRIAQTGCHCAIGTIFQVFRAAGVDTDREIPWLREWLANYQLPDGGWNCDHEAYLHAEKPSSIVATIAIGEALLACAPDLSRKELTTLDRAAACLIARELTKGSSTVANAEERDDEQDWAKLCFPRFYFYDVLRGLSFIARWAKFREQPLPECARRLHAQISAHHPGSQMRIERRAYNGVPSRNLGTWERTPASIFPLLDEVSQLGDISPYLSLQWRAADVICSARD